MSLSHFLPTKTSDPLAELRRMVSNSLVSAWPAFLFSRFSILRIVNLASAWLIISHMDCG